MIGDGSFNYDPAPAVYGAAQEHNLPFLTVMFNNQGYLSQKSGIQYYPEGWAVKSKNFSGLHIAPCPGMRRSSKLSTAMAKRSKIPAKCEKQSSVACAPWRLARSPCSTDSSRSNRIVERGEG